MTKELENKVTNILKSSQSKSEQAIAIFSLSELAWASGNISAYESLIKLLRKFFPETSSQHPLVLNTEKIRAGQLPDIDLD